MLESKYGLGSDHTLTIIELRLIAQYEGENVLKPTSNLFSFENQDA